MIRLYCATGNPGKLREFRMAAEGNPVEIDLLPGFRQILRVWKMAPHSKRTP